MRNDEYGEVMIWVVVGVVSGSVGGTLQMLHAATPSHRHSHRNTHTHVHPPPPPLPPFPTTSRALSRSPHGISQHLHFPSSAIFDSPSYYLNMFSHWTLGWECVTDSECDI